MGVTNDDHALRTAIEGALRATVNADGHHCIAYSEGQRCCCDPDAVNREGYGGEAFPMITDNLVEAFEARDPNSAIRPAIQVAFDTALGSMDFGSGLLDDAEVESLRALAVWLGVDPNKATPANFYRKYGCRCELTRSTREVVTGPDGCPWHEDGQRHAEGVPL